MKILGRILLFILVLALPAGLVMVFSLFVAVPWVTDFTRQMSSAYFFLTIGFWATLLIVVQCVAGFLLGKWEDGALRLPMLNRFRS